MAQPDIITFQETFLEATAPWVVELQHNQHYQMLFSHGYKGAKVFFLVFVKLLILLFNPTIVTDKDVS